MYGSFFFILFFYLEVSFVDVVVFILVLLSIWEVEKNLSKGKEDKPDFKLCLKVKVIYPMNEEDKDTVVFYYTQVIYAFMN